MIGPEEEVLSLSEFLELSPLPYQSLDEKGNIFYVNENWLNMLGYTRDEVLGKWFGDFLESNYVEQFQKNFSIFKQRGKIEDVEFELLRKDGSSVYASFNGKVSYDELGNFKQTFCIVKDVTEKRRAEERLVENAKNYFVLFERTSNPILVIDTKGNYVDCNKAGLQFLEINKEDLHSKNVVDFIPPGKEEEVLEEHKLYWDSGGTLEKEYYIHGKIKTLELTIVPAALNNRKVLFGVGRDVTKEKRTKEAEEALEESEERYRALYNSIRDAILVADTDRNIVDCNHAFTDLFGYSLDEIKGSKTYSVYESVEEYEEMGKRIGENIQQPNSNFFFTVNYQKKSGEVFLGETNVFYLRDRSGDITGFIGLIRDVSKQKEREKELELKSVLLDSATDSVFVHDFEGKFHYVNEAAYQDRGYSREELMNKNLRELVLPHYTEYVPSRFEELLRKGAIFFESAHVCKDGSVINVETQSRIISYEDQQLIVSICRDISEQKKAEAKRDEYQKLLSSTLEALGSLILVIDKDHRIILSNWKDHEWVSEEERDKKPYCYKAMKNLDAPCEHCPPAETFKDGKIRWYEDQNPIDGSFKEISVIPIFSEDGDVEYVVENVRDVTHRKQAEKRVEHLNSLLMSISNVNQLIVQEPDLEVLMRRACESIVETRSYRGATIALLNDGELIVPLAKAGEQQFVSEWFITPEGEGDAPKCIKEAFEVDMRVINDTSDCGQCSRTECAGHQRVAIIPLRRDEKIVGLLGVLMDKKVEVDQEERKLLQEVADDLAFARSKILAETALQESRNYLQGIFDGIQDGISVIDSEFNIIQTNKWVWEILSEDMHLVGKKCYQVYQLRSTPCPSCPSLKTLKTGEPQKEEIQFPRSDGSYRWIEVSTYPLKDENDNTIEVIEHLKDITEQKKAEKDQEALFYELKTINETVVKASRIDDIDEICQLIGRAVHSLNPDSYVAVSLYDRNADAIKIKEIIGLGDKAGKVLEIFGDPKEISICPDMMKKVAQLLKTGKLEKVDGIYDLMGGEIPQDICKQVEDILGVKSAHAVGFSLEGLPYGGISILSPRSEIDHRSAIESLASHFSVLIQRRQAEEDLRKSEELYSTLVEKVNDMVFMLNSKGDITFFNSYVKEHYYLSHEEAENLKGTHLSFFWCGESIDEVQDAISKVIEQREEQSLECVCEDRYYLLKINPLLDHGKLTGMIAVARDFTERRQMEDELQESKERFQTITENLPHGVFLHDLDGNILMVNRASCRNTGYTREELLSMTVRDIDPDSLTRDDRKNLWLELQTGDFAKINSTHYRKDGSKYVAEIYINAITLEGEPMMLAITQDITERQENERQIRESLKEKETLLKEVHHRVKNNLQVVSGLLYLQSNKVSQEASEALTDSMNRVKSMSLIHEELYQSDSLARIDFNDYVNRQLSHLLSSYNAEAIILNTDIQDVYLSIDTAIPTGLIINELVSNSLKHAFPDNQGKIDVSMYQKDKIKLTISDNGIGLPDMDFTNTNSLGMQLVNSLVKQIKGTIELHRDEGTTWEITFEGGEVKHGEEN